MPRPPSATGPLRPTSRRAGRRRGHLTRRPLPPSPGDVGRARAARGSLAPRPPFRVGGAAMSRGSAASWGARVAAGCDEDCDSDDDDCWDIGVPGDESQVGRGLAVAGAVVQPGPAAGWWLRGEGLRPLPSLLRVFFLAEQRWDTLGLGI